MAGAAGEDEAAWERAVASAVKSAPSSAPKTLTLDGVVKSSTGRLPSPSLFARYPSLEELSVAGARLSSLAGFPRLPALRRLSLPDNRLSGAASLAAVAEACGGTLRHLDLGNNRIAKVNELAPLAPHQVESLDLYQCPVTKVKGYREKVFALIPSLKYLDGMDTEGNDRLETDEEDDDDEDEEEDDDEDEEGDEDDEEEAGDEEEEGEGDEEMVDQCDFPFELLDPKVDQHHRARHLTSTVAGVDRQSPAELSSLRVRPPQHIWTIHPRWVGRLRGAGLLPLVRMIEGAHEGENPSRRFPFDRSLLTAWVDRWRPETHTFHLPIGEVTITLEDVTFLLGLPLAGAAVVPQDIGQQWRTDLLERFARAHPVLPRGAIVQGFTSTHGPTQKWLRQFQAEHLPDDADDYTVSRHLEAYLLWLFGWVMFTGTHGDSVDKHMVEFARAIADAEEEDVPQYSWGSAVLCATYRGLCDACQRRTDGGTITGCPLLLQIWSFERVQIGRPIVDLSAYGPGDPNELVDRPTMGTVWCRRRPSWAHKQTHLSYPDYIAQLDQLRADDFRWRPYLMEDVNTRAPHGISTLCTRDSEYWLTRRCLVFDVHVEGYTVYRVLRQFGLHQVFPCPVEVQVPIQSHRHTRKGVVPVRTPWQVRMAPWVQQWEEALEDVHGDDDEYDPSTYDDYLRWYVVRTRVRLVRVSDTLSPRVANVTETYPRHMLAAVHASADLVWQARHEADSMLQRWNLGYGVPHETMKGCLQAIICRLDKSLRLTSPRPPPAATSYAPSRPPASNAVGSQSWCLPPTPLAGYYSSYAAGTSQGVPPIPMSQAQYYQGGTDPAYYSPTGMVDLAQYGLHGSGGSHEWQSWVHRDAAEVGPSQLQGAPLATQPIDDQLSSRQARRRHSPDRFTHSGHRPKRGGGRRGGQ